MHRYRPSSVMTRFSSTFTPVRPTQCTFHAAWVCRVKMFILNYCNGYKHMGLLPNLIVKRLHVAEHDFSSVVINLKGSEFQKGITFKTGQVQLLNIPALMPTIPFTSPERSASHRRQVWWRFGLSAQQGLELAKIESGRTVLINGGTTSVGSSTIQMVKARGCKVVATCFDPQYRNSQKPWG